MEGPAAGSDSIVLGVSGSWTASANVSWIHLSPGNQSGSGGATVAFSFDANPGQTRAGTLFIADQAVSITQAGASYIAAPGPVTTIVGSGLGYPNGVAVDGSGNVYIADSGHNAIKEWTPANNTLTTLVSLGLNSPESVAVDGQGNVYIADTINSAIKKWMAEDGGISTLVSSGLFFPGAVALDGSGDVYIADTYDNAIKWWSPGTGNLTTFATGLSSPAGVAVDAAGNIYMSDTYSNRVLKFSVSTFSLTELVSSGLNFPEQIAVDGSGNVYIADSGNYAIKKWTAANNTVTTLLSSGLNHPQGVAADGSGNVYIADYDNNAVKELPYAFLDATPRREGAAAGSDNLPNVLPGSVNLGAPFAPRSSQSWLNITGVTNGQVTFSFTANNTAFNREASITVLGQPVTIIQYGIPSLGVSSLLEGPASGVGSIVLSSPDPNLVWTASANATWLHLSATNQSGTGGAILLFSFDANPGPTRTGSLAIAGQTLTVTQAGLDLYRGAVDANSTGLANFTPILSDRRGR